MYNINQENFINLKKSLNLILFQVLLTNLNQLHKKDLYRKEIWMKTLNVHLVGFYPPKSKSQQDGARVQNRNAKCFQIHPNQYPTKISFCQEKKPHMQTHSPKSNSQLEEAMFRNINSICLHTHPSQNPHKKKLLPQTKTPHANTFTQIKIPTKVSYCQKKKTPLLRQ